MEVFLPNRSAARQGSLGRSSTSSSSVMKSFPSGPLGESARFLGLFLHPSREMHWCPSGVFCKVLSPGFGVAVTSVSVPGAVTRLLRKCGSARLVLLLLETALSVWVSP